MTARAALMAKCGDGGMPAPESFLNLCRTLRSYHDDSDDVESRSNGNDEPEYDLTDGNESKAMTASGKYSTLSVADPQFWPKLIANGRRELKRLTLTSLQEEGRSRLLSREQLVKDSMPTLDDGVNATDSVCPFLEDDLGNSINGSDLVLLVKAQSIKWKITRTRRRILIRTRVRQGKLRTRRRK